MQTEIVPVVYGEGTHRSQSPATTLERVRALAPAMGITRLADVTGLDCIGIPVVMAVRPNARSLAVSQGKGASLDAARASALMEAVELFHAEHAQIALTLASYEELRYTHRVVDPAFLSRIGEVGFDAHKSILWTTGVDIARGDDAEVWLPFEIVHANFSTAALPESGCFAISSNGLASGNHLVEAVAHGVYECIERDATTLLFSGNDDARQVRRLDLESVDDEACRDLLARFDAAEVDVGVWDATSDVGLPVFSALVCDRDPNSPRGLFAASGAGCHASRAIALTRALTEAAQSRLTYISGARDDAFRKMYEDARNVDRLARQRTLLGERGTRAFGASPHFDATTLNEALAFAIRQLDRAGFPEVIVVDLTRPDFRIPVARVVVPGLEGDVEDGIARASERVRERVTRLFGTP